MSRGAYLVNAKSRDLHDGNTGTRWMMAGESPLDTNSTLNIGTFMQAFGRPSNNLSEDGTSKIKY